ncbi:hypothetical protein SPBRAN_1764 [uncultured Candidatus Thioglobus sp.]|nr:hypothetical protein SPBRAN_1764 [uncultured Candidatus Thioglobus sp.]
MNKQQFWQALADYQHQDEAAKKKTSTWLWDKYGLEIAVLIIDMSGFTAKSEQYGIIHYLSMIKRMQMMVSDSIGSHQGQIVKFFADNCMATFINPIDAFNFSIALNQQCHSNSTKDEFEIRLSCGIDFGRILMVEGQDCFGMAVNHASKLGEDTAKHGQILITQKAADLFPENISADPQSSSISGVEIVFYTVEYESYQTK